MVVIIKKKKKLAKTNKFYDMSVFLLTWRGEGDRNDEHLCPLLLLKEKHKK